MQSWSRGSCGSRSSYSPGGVSWGLLLLLGLRYLRIKAATVCRYQLVHVVTN